MTGINSISGIRPPIQSPATQGGDQASKQATRTSFTDMLMSYIDKVDQDQGQSAEAIKNLISGKSDEILPTVAAVAKADMSFKLLMGIRNKVIDAYKQTMNMQV